jgi:hypothetical protein
MARYIVTGDAIYVPREAGARVYRQSGKANGLAVIELGKIGCLWACIGS